ncbi:MAG: ATP-binding protein [Pseudomonadota bacterium]
MTNTIPTTGERLAGATGLVSLLAALAGVAAIALGILGGDSLLYTAEGVIAILLLALGLREAGSRLHLRRQTRELRSNMREIEEKNRLLNLTEANAHVGHWRLDLTTDDVFWSEGTFAIHGVEGTQSPDLASAIDFYHPDDRESVTHSIESSRRTGEPYAFRARIIRTDGAIRHTETVARVEFDELGSPIAMFGVFRDRTDEEKMQEQLREARDKARALADAKSTFLAKMSHEIRTPMNGVLGFTELLQASELDPEQRRHIDLIAESGQSLQTLLNDILDLTKIEAGHIEIDPNPTEIATLIHRVAQMIEPLGREKALKVERVVDSALPPMVLVDSLRLRQILTNLMQNAVRFTDHGKIRISAVRRADKLEILVADTGIGIEPDAQETIFAAFAQIDDAAASERGGTGLGLAICRQLTELMDGTLTVRSIPGKGSAFTLTLPLLIADDAPTISSSPKQVEPSGYFADRRILLAEDFDINRELLGQMARRLGLELTMAEDGAEAVEMVELAQRDGHPFELVLMDIRMPRMDGLEASKALRAKGFDQAGLPILALTANAFEDDVATCIEAGMQEHLAKPISIETLRMALERWLPDPRQRAA